MTDTALSPQQVADFLQENPQFFTTHADVFADIRVPHPHGSGTISLGERQILTLRERNRELEWRLKELVHNANANESISGRLVQWCARLLAETQLDRIPGEIALGLAREFDLNEVGLRLWALPNLPEGGYGEAVSDDVHTFAESLKSPYCGTDTEFEAASWLSAKPKSLALIPLRPSPEAPTVGLLVLGSDDPERFAPDMATTFLDTVGQLASAALRRLA
jgi:uncharacterized protein YigA (DUF484 family)